MNIEGVFLLGLLIQIGIWSDSTTIVWALRVARRSLTLNRLLYCYSLTVNLTILEFIF